METALVIALVLAAAVVAAVGVVVGARLGARRVPPVVVPAGPTAEELARRAADDSVRVYMEQALAQQRAAIDQAFAQNHLTMEQALAQNREILEQERRIAAGDLDGKKSLIDQQLASMHGELGKVEELVRSLEEFGLVVSRAEGGERLYREADAEIAAAAGRLQRYGIDARHLRTFKNGAGREAALLEQLVAPALRARSPERRKAGLDDLQVLAEAAQELSQLLFWRELRLLAER